MAKATSTDTHLAGSVEANSVPAISSAIVLGTVGVLSFIIQPGLVAAFVSELGLQEPQAVNLAGIEMSGVAAATIFLAIFGARLNWRSIVVGGLMVATLGNLLSALLLEGSNISMARFLAGLGHGAIISISFTLIGATKAVERNLALYLCLLLTYGAFGLWYLPSFLNIFSLEVLFIVFAVTCVLALITAAFIPTAASSDTIHNPEARQLSRSLIVVALAGVLAYNLAQGIAWGVLFLIGVGAGHEEQAVADALFASQICAIGGALLSLFLAGRVGSHKAIIAGIFGGAASIALLIGSPAYAPYLIAVCGFNLLWNFVLPFILGKVSNFETSGRMMSYAIALQMVGLGVGPLLAAQLIGDGSYLAVELVCIGLFVASYVLLLRPILAHRRLLAA